MNFEYLDEPTAVKLVLNGRDSAVKFLQQLKDMWSADPHSHKSICSAVSNLGTAILVGDILSGRGRGGLNSDPQTLRIIELFRTKGGEK